MVLTGLPGTKLTMAKVRKVTPSKRGIICNRRLTMNPVTRRFSLSIQDRKVARD